MSVCCLHIFPSLIRASSPQASPAHPTRPHYMATEPSRRLLDDPRLPSLPPTSTLRSDPSRLRSGPIPTEVDATGFLLHCTPPLHGTRPPPIYDATFDPPQCTSVLFLVRTCNMVPSVQCAFSTSSSTGMHLHRRLVFGQAISIQSSTLLDLGPSTSLLSKFHLSQSSWWTLIQPTR